MAAQKEYWSDVCIKRTCCALLVAAVIAAFVSFAVFVGESKDPVYSVTVTGVAGLADSSFTPAPLSPVFNLTVRIDNARNRMSQACIGRLSTMVLSYQDARLGRGSVPQFCTKEAKVRERAIRAWSQGVTLPQFLRDQLAGELAAGEASVNIIVTTPAKYPKVNDIVLICNNVRIGGGPGRCRTESVYHQQQQQDYSSW